jgi:hypothetical protein
MTDQDQAITHLRTQCVPADPSDAALIAEWNTAKARLGNAIPNCGQPQIQDIDPQHVGRAQQLLASPWCGPYFAGPASGAQFKMIELDPLLAFQFTISKDRSDHHCAALTKPPTVPQLLTLCLPNAPQSETFQTFSTPAYSNSLMLKSRSLNLQLQGYGVYNAAFMGIQFGPSLPFLHVVRFNGRCYLHNGFHRALGIRAAGATHAPCVLRDVPDAAAVGIRIDGGTFGQSLLESSNPPTVAHFTQSRAYDVQLRNVARYLHVSWAEYVIPQE